MYFFVGILVILILILAFCVLALFFGFLKFIAFDTFYKLFRKNNYKFLNIQNNNVEQLLSNNKENEGVEFMLWWYW